MMRLTTVAIALLLTSAGLSASKNEVLTLSSGSERVALLELYTSEGCSSCPPADRWLSSLETHPDLFETFVPVAFHVDYWNYIGWRDRFSDAAFSKRQRRYIAEGAARAVYTPGFFNAGEEWLGWRRRDPVITGTADTAGELTVRIEDADLAAHFVPEARVSGQLELHIAVLGMNLETEVRAGENRGRKLEHDFVILSHSVTRLEAAGAAWGGRADLDLEDAETSDLAIAVWVARRGSQVPLQATGGFLVRH